MWACRRKRRQAFALPASEGAGSRPLEYRRGQGRASRAFHGRARREAEEESGLAIGAIQFLCVSEQIIPADRQHWVSLIYVTHDFAGEPQLTEPDKLSDIGWYGLDELPQPLSRFAADAVAALKAQAA